jgi:hypothetical protein
LDLVTNAEENDDIELAAAGSPFNSSMILPTGNFSYVAHATLGEYSAIQVEADIGGIPKHPPPFPPHLGAFRTEPVLWIGFAYRNDPHKPLPTNSSDPLWAAAFTPKMFSCQHYVTNYTVLFNFTSGIQNATVVSVDYLRPVIATTFLPGINAMDGTKDNTTAVPQSHYVYPRDIEHYRLIGAYHSLGYLMRSLINGTISMAQGSDAPIQNTEAIKTRLIDPATYLAVPQLMTDIQSFYEDLILSLLSNPQFLAVAWARDPSHLSGTGSANGTDGDFACVKSRTINAFKYSAADLWMVYGFAIFFTTLSLVLGATAITQNSGVVCNTRFSSIVAATRARELDEIGWSGGAGGRFFNVPVEAERTRLGYGRISNSDASRAGSGVEFGFGIEGRVRQRLGSVLSFQD